MEIRGSLIPAWQPTSANTRTATEQRDGERSAAAERPTESGPIREYISQGEIVQGKGAGDYREALAQARRGRDENGSSSAAPSNESQKTQQALEAYRSNANSVENGGVELLPRVDGYA
jgi:hypothetical protein